MIINLKSQKYMDAKITVLEAMKKDGTALQTGKIVELTNLDRKVVEKAMNDLKAEGSIISPKRCFWQAK